MRDERIAPIPDDEPAKPAQVLNGHRLVEAEGVLEPADVLVIDVGARLVCRERAAGDRLEDRERGDADAEQQRQRLQEATQDVAGHYRLRTTVRSPSCTSPPGSRGF